MTSLADVLPAPDRPRFDLKAEAWIPVYEPDTGASRDVSLADVLQHSHRLQLAAADPLVEHALLRYLTALTYLAVAYTPDAGWPAVAAGDAPLPSDAVDAVLDRVADHTWLIHPDTPFLQQPRLRTLMPVRTGTAATSPAVASTVSFDYLRPEVPTGNNPVWFNRDRIGADPNDAEAARGVLLRHYFALPGNETGHRLHGKPRFFSPGGGAMAAFYPRGRTFVCLRGTTLAQTLTANLVADISDVTTPDTPLFWEAPDDPTRHLDEPLYRYTASGASTLLVEHDGTYRVLRSAGMFTSKQQATSFKKVLASHDPHTLRVDPLSAAAKKSAGFSAITFDPDAHQHANLHTFLTWTDRSELHRPSLLAPHATTVARPPGTALQILDVSGYGQATGPSIAAAVQRLADVGLYQPDPARRAVLQTVLARVGASSRSARAALRRAIGRAIADPDKLPTLYRLLDQRLWEVLDDHVGAAVDQALTSPDPTADLDDDRRATFVRAVVDLYRDLTRPYTASADRLAAAAEQIHPLRRVLWTL